MEYNKILKVGLGALMTVGTFTSAFAQAQITFTGTVVDETDIPIIGAAVRIAGQTQGGTITDLDGKFTIKVPQGGAVEISYIGYSTLRVTDFSQVKIVMKEDTQQLDEVVVVGYGVQKKAHLTGAISTVPMDEIQDLVGGDLASSLSGLVNGLSVSGGDARPGAPARLSIRGSGDVSALGSTAQEPLFVIDGFIYPNDVKVGNTMQNLGSEAFNNLDPSMIESISVLKDAAAAVYGARAANGVVLVTTKRGKMGAPQISYSGSFGITDAVGHAKMLNSYDYGRLWNAVKAADPLKTDLNPQLDLFQADELAAMRGLNYNLLDKYWETGITQKHSVNLSGASEKANYYAGISYFDQEGNLGKLDYDRWNFRAGVDLQIAKGFKASLQVSGDYGKKTNPLVKVGGTDSENDYRRLLYRPRYIPEYVNGLPIAAYGISNEKKGDDQVYHFDVLQNNGDYSSSMSQNLTINSSLEYDFSHIDFLKGLNVRFSYAKSISTNKNNQYGTEYNLYQMSRRAGSGQHLYTPIPGQEAEYEALMDENNFILANGGNSVDNGDMLSRTMDRTDNYQMNLTLSYSRDFGDHHVSALFSIEKSETESEWMTGQVTDPYEFTTGQSNSVGMDSEMTTNWTRAESGTLSYIGRINYAYNDRYLLEFLLRSDASTKFAPENYWGTFPSVSAGWVMSEEGWFKDHVKFIDYLKLRASFGLTGRDNTTPWQWMQTYGMDLDKGPVIGTGTGNNAGTHISLNKNNSAVNRDAHWDKTYKANVGLDFNVLDNRLAFNIDGYYEWNREMLTNYSASVPGTVGTQSAKVNYGKLDSYGVEVGITWRDNIGKDFKYKIGLNTGYTDNKVLLMDWATDYLFRSIQEGDRTDQGTWGMQCLGMFRNFQEIDEYFAKYNITSYMGMSKDEVRPGMLIYKDVRGPLQEDGTYAGPDGIVDKDNDQVELSHRGNPYGVTANLSADWKGFSISAQLGASWGGYSIVPTSALKAEGDLEYSNMPSFWNVDNMYSYQDVYDASGNLVVAENRDAKYPNLAYSSVNSVASTFWRISSTRISLNRLTLAYALPSSVTKMLGIQSCRFNVTGQNLLSLYNPYPDNFMDPMSSFDSYPSLRKFTVGINISF